MKSFGQFCVALILVLLSRVAHTFIPHGLPIAGLVLEAGTLRPVANAMVSVRWEVDIPVIGHGTSACVHADTAVTNAIGFYWFAPWVKVSRMGPVIVLGAIGDAYKRGYEEGHYWLNPLIYMKRFEGSPEQRLKDLYRISIGCKSPNESNESSLVMLRAIHDEVAGMEDTYEQRKSKEWFRYQMEHIELGYRWAEDRHNERLEEMERRRTYEIYGK